MLSSMVSSVSYSNMLLTFTLGSTLDSSFSFRVEQDTLDFLEPIHFDVLIYWIFQAQQEKKYPGCLEEKLQLKNQIKSCCEQFKTDYFIEESEFSV